MAKPNKDSSASIPSDVLLKFLTKSELRMLNNRFQILQLRKEGLSVRKIASELSVGTDTVTRILKQLGDPKKLRRKAISSKWVFGQVSTKEDIH